MFEDGEVSVITQPWVPKFIRNTQETKAGVYSGSPLEVVHTSAAIWLTWNPSSLPLQSNQEAFLASICEWLGYHFMQFCENACKYQLFAIVKHLPVQYNTDQLSSGTVIFVLVF